MIHKLKTWPEYFQAIADRLKTFEFRENDRNFEVGHILVLEEYDYLKREYTDRCIKVVVTYKIQGVFGLSPLACIMSFNEIERNF